MLEIHCECGAHLRLGEEWAGKKGRCPQCDRVLVLPAASDAKSLPEEFPAPPAVGAKPATASARRASGDGPPPLAGVSRPPLPLTTPPPVPSPRYGAPPRRLVRRLRLDRIGNLRRAGLLAGGAAAALLILLLLVLALRSRNSVTNGTEAGRQAAEVGTAGVHSGETPEESVAEPPVTASDRQRPRPPLSPGAEVVGPPLTAPRPDHPNEAGRHSVPPAARSGDSEGGLVGMSGQYDDTHCQQIQFRYGIRVPSAADIIEVDGMRLPVVQPGALAASPAPILMLPRGTHAVRFRAKEMPVEVKIASHLFDEYRAMREFFGVPESVRTQELMSRGARAMDVHGAPFLLNFMGAAHAKAGRWEVAEREFRRALTVNPTFSPAHLNLAECLLRRDQQQEARREVLLADAFNVGNVYGLAPGVAQLRARLGVSMNERDAVAVAELAYAGREAMSEEDRCVVALLEGISKYAVRVEERGKILNNLAVHFADSGRPELALHYFRNALGVIRYAGPERFELARNVFDNMSNTCREAGFDEADEYRRMKLLVAP